MKKLLLILISVSMLFCISTAHAEKPTNWVDLTNIHSNNNINIMVGDEYYPIQFYFDGMAISSEGGKYPVRSVLNLGTPQAEPFDLKTLEGQKAWYQALPAILQPVAKDLRMKATAEDISE